MKKVLGEDFEVLTLEQTTMAKPAWVRFILRPCPVAKPNKVLRMWLLPGKSQNLKSNTFHLDHKGMSFLFRHTVYCISLDYSLVIQGEELV